MRFECAENAVDGFSESKFLHSSISVFLSQFKHKIEVTACKWTALCAKSPSSGFEDFKSFALEGIGGASWLV